MKKQNIILWGLLAISIISLIPLFLLSFYAHPAADDFAYSITTYEVWKSSRNLFAVLKEAVMTSIRYWGKWQGLYTSAFLLALQPGIFGEQYYAVTGIIIIGTISISNLILSWYLLHLRLGADRLFAVTMGFILTSVMFNYFPSMEDGVYWCNGAMNYTFFMGILLLLVCALLELCRKKEIRCVKSKIIIGSALAFLLSGGNHITAFAGMLFTGGMIVFLAVMRHIRGIKRISVIFAVETAGFLLNLLSPGTAKRHTALGGGHGIFRSIWKSVSYILESIDRWVGLELIVLLIILLPFFWQLAKKMRKEYQYQFSYPLLIFMGSVGMLAAMMFPAFYALGVEGSSRVVNVPYMTFIILVFGNELYICGWLQNKITDFEVIWTNGWMLTTAVLLFGILVGCCETTHGYEAYQCIASGQAGLYSQEADARYNLLIRSAGQDVEVTSYSVYPGLLFSEKNDVSEDSEDSVNQQIEKFYQLNSIIRK